MKFDFMVISLYEVVLSTATYINTNFILEDEPLLMAALNNIFLTDGNLARERMEKTCFGTIDHLFFF